MDAATFRRLNQVAVWTAARFNDFEAMYDGIRASVWTGDRFKDGGDDRVFIEAIQKVATPFRLAVECTVNADEFDRLVTMRSTLSSGGGALTVGLTFGWTLCHGMWQSGNIIGISIRTSRVSVTMNLREAPDWRQVPIPFPDDPVPECRRNLRAPDVGPVIENEVVSMIAGMCGMDVAYHAQRALLSCV